jgi:hypothetical protein
MAQEKKTVTITIDPRKLKGFTRGQQLLSVGHLRSASETWIKSFYRLLKEKEYKKAGFVALQANELLHDDKNTEISKDEKNQILANFLTATTIKLKKLLKKDETLPAAQRQLLGHFTQIHNNIALSHYSKGDFSSATRCFLLANDAYNQTLELTGQTHAAFLYEVQRNLMLYKATIAQLCLNDHKKSEEIFKIAEDNYNNFLKKNHYDINDQNNCIAKESDLIFHIIRTSVSVAVDKTPSKEELSDCIISAEELLKNLHLSFKLKYITIVEIINILELIRSKLSTPKATTLRLTEICYELDLLSVDYNSRIDYSAATNEISEKNQLEIKPHIKGLQIMKMAVGQMNCDQHEDARENFLKSISLLNNHPHLALDTCYAFTYSAIFNRHYSDIVFCTEKLFSSYVETFNQELFPNQYQDEFKRHQDYSTKIILSCRQESKFSVDETIKSAWDNLADIAKENLNSVAEFVEQKSKGITAQPLKKQKRTTTISEKSPLLASRKSALRYCTDLIEAVDHGSTENLDNLNTIAKTINIQYMVCRKLQQTIKDNDRQSVLENQSSAYGNLLYTVGALVKNLEHTLNDKPDLIFAIAWLHFTQQEFNKAAQLWIKMVSDNQKKIIIDLIWLMIYQNNYSETQKAKATLKYLNFVTPLLEKSSDVYIRHIELQAHNYFLIATDHLYHKNYTDALPALLASRKNIELIKNNQGHSISDCLNSALLTTYYIKQADFINAQKHLDNAKDALKKTTTDGKGLQSLTLGCEIHFKLSTNDASFNPLSIIPTLKQYKDICDHIIPIDDYLLEILLIDIESIATLLIKKIED